MKEAIKRIYIDKEEIEPTQRADILKKIYSCCCNDLNRLDVIFKYLTLYKELRELFFLGLQNWEIPLERVAYIFYDLKFDIRFFHFSILNNVIKSSEDLTRSQFIAKMVDVYFKKAINPNAYIPIPLNDLPYLILKELDISLLSNRMDLMTFLLFKHRKLLSEEQRLQIIEKLKIILKRSNANLDKLPIDKLKEDEYDALKGYIFLRTLMER